MIGAASRVRNVLERDGNGGLRDAFDPPLAELLTTVRGGRDA